MAEPRPVSLFPRFSAQFSKWAGHPTAFVVASGIVLLWAICGPYFDFSETWQLVINTGTTIITFLMVFILQNSQTRESSAFQAKLDELILTSHAQNVFVGIEHLDENQIRILSRELAQKARNSKVRPRAAGLARK